MRALARELPDPDGALLFYERVSSESPRAARLLERDPALLADVLALAAWSPFLATTLERNPEYVAWLSRERGQARVRTAEELSESLARFSLTHSQLDPQVMLSRFRRRELLRIYLNDIRRVANIVETTEELSNLADAVLRYALGLAGQELENLYGQPQCTDARGRKMTAALAVVALGKLGSRELNYSSDIDLFFLYSDDGETTGRGERGAVTNREFFCKLAERISKTVGRPAGEGAAYRVDLRLRPHGRDGALASSLAEAVRYYLEKAHAWELQALIRARASAGSDSLFARFSSLVRPRIYREDETVARALAHVRLAKQKIDRHHGGEASRGFNVKLGRGGIREIEFIAQALQLAHGGRDSWLHAPHTLISLGRLVERGLIEEAERGELSEAYAFLRTLEHRLQMDQGLQSHNVPEERERRALVARRMHFTGSDALSRFNAELEHHASNVSRVFARVFEVEDEAGMERACSDEGMPRGDAGSSAVPPSALEAKESALESDGAVVARFDEEEEHSDARTEATHANFAASVFTRYFERAAGRDAGRVERLARILLDEASRSLNRRRALTLLARIAASLEKSEKSPKLSGRELVALVRLCGTSEYLGEKIASDPALLIPRVNSPAETVKTREHRALLRAAVDAEKSFGAELSALRRAWASLLVEIGARDVGRDLTHEESNALQSSLAAASINASLLIARRELARRYGRLAAGPRLAVLGLGRLGSGGMDFGSDLDLVLVYDPEVPPPLEGLTHDEAYARLVELMTNALSSLTRDGTLYRVDLRLRPDGMNGPLASSSRSFINYLDERADVWEWLAYVKLRAVAGDLEFGRAVERDARSTLHGAARRAGEERLRVETRRVRERLERERARRAIDIKYGAGGLLDIYFVVRFLQLRSGLPDEGDLRSTSHVLSRLVSASVLDEEGHRVLAEGYALMRRIDHALRLLVGRTTRVPEAEDHPVLRDLARLTEHDSPASLKRELAARMSRVRGEFDRITGA